MTRGIRPPLMMFLTQDRVPDSPSPPPHKHSVSEQSTLGIQASRHNLALPARVDKTEVHFCVMAVKTGEFLHTRCLTEEMKIKII